MAKRDSGVTITSLALPRIMYLYKPYFTFTKNRQPATTGTACEEILEYSITMQQVEGLDKVALSIISFTQTLSPCQ